MVGFLSLSPELMLMISSFLTDSHDFWRFSLVCRQTRYMFPLRFIAKQDADRQRREAPPDIEIPFPRSQFPMLITAIRSSAACEVLKPIIDAYAEAFPAALNGQWGRGLYNIFPLHEALGCRRYETCEYFSRLPCCRVDMRCNTSEFEEDGPNLLMDNFFVARHIDALLVATRMDQRLAARCLLEAGHTVHGDHFRQAAMRKNDRLMRMLLEAYGVQPALDAASLADICRGQIRRLSKLPNFEDSEAVLDLLLPHAPDPRPLYTYADLAETALKNHCPHNALWYFKTWIQTTAPEDISPTELGTLASAAFATNAMDLIRAIHPAHTSQLVGVRDKVQPGLTPEEREQWGFRFLVERALLEAAKQPAAVLADALPYLFVSSSCPASSAHLWRAVLLPDPVPYLDLLVAYGADTSQEFETLVDVETRQTRWVYPLAEAILLRRGPAVFRLLHHGASPRGLGEDVIACLEDWYTWVVTSAPVPRSPASERVTLRDLSEGSSQLMPKDVSIFSSTSPADLTKQIMVLYAVIVDEKMARR